MKYLSLLIIVILLTSCASQAASPSIAAPTPTPPPLEKVNFCYTALTGSQSSIWYAYEKGFFRKNNIDLVLTGVTTSSSSVSVSIASLTAGDFDLCLISGATAMNGTASGLDIVTIGSLFNIYPYVLMVPPSIQTAADLKGKTLAIASAASPATSAMRIMLKNLGLDPEKDVTLVPIGEEQARLAALQAGQVVGAPFIAPTTLIARKAGFHVMLDMAELKMPYLHTNIVTTRAYLAAHHDTALNFMRAYCEAIAAMKSDPTGTKEVIAQYTKLDVQNDADILDEIYASFIQRGLEKIPFPNIEGVKNLQVELGTTNPAALKLKAEDYLDLSLLKELEKDGLFTRLYP